MEIVVHHRVDKNSSSGPSKPVKTKIESSLRSQPVKKFIACCGPRRFIAVFSRARHCSLSWARLIHSTPSRLISLRSFLIFSHLRLSLPTDVFPSGFPPKILYAYHNSPVRVMCHANLITLDLMIRKIFGEEQAHTFWSTYSSIRSAFTIRCSLIFSHLHPAILSNLSHRAARPVHPTIFHPRKKNWNGQSWFDGSWSRMQSNLRFEPNLQCLCVRIFLVFCEGRGLAVDSLWYLVVSLNRI
jgi:hypothetical protein